ncbi:MAG: EAL domain-containing protein [Hyphomonas sp.]|nr:EAL domain-containing protein [Hyphomonas sp.]
MSAGTSHLKTTKLDMSERTRMHAYWVGILGLGFAAFLYLLYHASGKDTWLVRVVIPTYAVLLGGITLSAHRNFHVRSIFFNGCMAMFALFWVKNFGDGFVGNSRAFDLPVILLVPLFFMMALDTRRLLMLAPVQFVCVFCYTWLFADLSFNVAWTPSEQFAFSLVVAALSGFSICLFAVVTFSRQRADENLFELVTETEKLAATDALTGLMNRRAFMDKLRALWPTRSEICIVFVDLNHFKPLNDQYGHAVGDEVLCKVAQRIGDVPHVELSARLGGDEFAVLFGAEACEETMAAHIETLHAQITQDMRWESGVIPIGASIGYAHGQTVEQSLSGLLRAADTAMRRAKSANTHWAKFNPLVDNDAIASSTLEMELKSAIKNGQIRAAVQPIANAHSLDVVAYELLTRWTNSGFERDPSPKDFIPIAEKLGLLNEILWVTLDEALTKLNLTDQKLAINVSPAQLVASDFLESLLRILERHEVRPHAITIEITEEVAFRNVDRNVAILRQARELGFAIALDDFGTGYSSLSMLDTLPLDKLKIDQSFVQKSDKSTQSKSILLAAIRLAKQLGLESCVEGIETEQAARRIALLGADTIQGYWLGKPRLVQDEPPSLKMVS